MSPRFCHSAINVWNPFAFQHSADIMNSAPLPNSDVGATFSSGVSMTDHVYGDAVNVVDAMGQMAMNGSAPPASANEHAHLHANSIEIDAVSQFAPSIQVGSS
jgi:hypothetical protein